MLLYNIYLTLLYVLLYLQENFTCLLYGLDILLTKYLFLISYYDLLVDISEGFGVWIALLILILASLTLLITIQISI